jgi:hypothetical protein
MNIGKDVIRLIFLHEKIQTALLEGGTLSPDEAILIRQCATELLKDIPAPTPAPTNGKQFIA